jgi:multiple sugar transport system ATP-binding protein
MSVIFRNIGKRYGEVPVLRHFDLDIHEHEFMVLVGPSGCGKTTALRLIAGLEDVSEGELLIGGRVMNAVAPKDRDVAMVFQNYALYPQMTVRQNLAFGLKIRKLAAAEIDRQVESTAGMLGLQPLLDRKPKALSGGQRQRVALGRAIVRKPAVFLFDEPLSNLDADLRVLMRAELSKLQRRLSTTTVYVTHDQVEAMTLGHRITVLSPLGKDGRGNLQQTGTPLELYERPNNVFVARFIGTPSMNMLTATVGADGRLVGAGFSLAPPLHFTAALKGYAGRTVLVGLRPEHLAEPGAHGWPRTATVQGAIDIIEATGPEVIVHVRVGDEALVAKLAARRELRYGESLKLDVNCNAMHLFDPASEERLKSDPDAGA